ncbi:MAG: bifunctional glycosyltransferase family 2/GtrA family protein [Thermodesulfobacteriota bacterium]|nr:bifunctional glycosyltransferase family 2/GtrA family protein [Thermodesulfobacteriota bacterium]
MMNEQNQEKSKTLSIVIPCYNEEGTLAECVRRVLAIADESLSLEIIIVDDASSDSSLSHARELEADHPEIVVLNHHKNQGKGAALRTGFARATGDYVVVQDADLEYDANDLKRLIAPLIQDRADVVLGSRFLSPGAHRVFHFWHFMGNRLLTFLSNMFTDLNLTDMEACYKAFKRRIIQGIDIRENRFGFEPEIVAKIAHQRLRIYEIGITYYGRTYAEGKKIGIKDGLRALYCIFRYNAHRAPVPIQFFIYLMIGGLAAMANLAIFLMLMHSGLSLDLAAPIAYVSAAGLNYLMCILLLFRHKARWGSAAEVIMYILVVAAVGVVDLAVTKALTFLGISPAPCKLAASLSVLVLNFLGRRFLVFPEPSSGPWGPPQALSADE